MSTELLESLESAGAVLRLVDGRLVFSGSPAQRDAAAGHTAALVGALEERATRQAKDRPVPWTEEQANAYEAAIRRATEERRQARGESTAQRFGVRRSAAPGGKQIDLSYLRIGPYRKHWCGNK